MNAICRIPSHANCLANVRTKKRIARRMVIARNLSQERYESVSAKLAVARLEAIVLCVHMGDDSAVCKVAYDKVWDLETAFYRIAEERREERRDPLEKYCEVVPEADECREYDV